MSYLHIHIPYPISIFVDVFFPSPKAKTSYLAQEKPGPGRLLHALGSKEDGRFFGQGSYGLSHRHRRRFVWAGPSHFFRCGHSLLDPVNHVDTKCLIMTSSLFNGSNEGLLDFWTYRKALSFGFHGVSRGAVDANNRPHEHDAPKGS